MKKFIMICGLAVVCFAMTGCAALMFDRNGFPVVAGGALISDMSGAAIVQPRETYQRKYVVVGPVKSQATTVNYCGLVSSGDASYSTLKKLALDGKGDDIINLEVDYHQDNLLGLVHKVTITLRGTAIKYKN